MNTSVSHSTTWNHQFQMDSSFITLSDISITSQITILKRIQNICTVKPVLIRSHITESQEGVDRRILPFSQQHVYHRSECHETSYGNTSGTEYLSASCI